MRKKIVTFLCIFIALAAGLLAYTFYDLPSIHAIPERLNQPSVRITDRKGRPLYEIIPSDGGRHAALDSASLPQCIKQATIAVEDRHFYQHPGVDITGIARAFWINLQGGETLAGGSTITQQVARSLLMTQEERAERSLRRKLREAALAWQLSRELPKDEILALYLNQTYYGGLAYGVEAAAQTYFGKPASDLLLPECALLAGLPQSPGIYNPFTNPEKARERQKVVLGLMEKDGYITPAQRIEAEQAPLSYNPAPYPIQAAHFVWMVKAQLDELYQSGEISPTQSLVIRTTLDLDMQRVAETNIARQIAIYKRPDGRMDENVNNAAALVLDPKTGEVLALVGSAGYFDAAIKGAVNMAATPRQPGSAFKPFLYALALDPARPHPWSAATVLFDVTTTFQTRNGQPYTPKNFNWSENGPVSLRNALASSLNIPAVLTIKEVGVENAIHLAQQLGIGGWDNPEEYDLSLALGGGQISLIELGNAYAAFANQGIYLPHREILEIRDADSNLVYQPTPTIPRQVFDPRVAWLISHILADDDARALGFGRNSALRIDRPAAVKTGTTTNFHDNWTIGYTPEILVGVWVGNSDYQAMRNVSGLTGAAPIWHNTLRELLQGRPKSDFPRPEGMTQVTVCEYSGLLPSPACDRIRDEWFIAGTEPTQTDTIYQQTWLDALTNTLADSSTPTERRVLRTVYNFPAPLQTWARNQGFLLSGDLAATELRQNDIFYLKITQPRPQTSYQITPKLSPETQQIRVTADVGAGFMQASLWVDGRKLAECSPGASCEGWWQLTAGVHQFWVEGVAPSGERIQSEKVEIKVDK